MTKKSTPDNQPSVPGQNDEVLRQVLRVLDENKAENVCVFDLREEGTLFEYSVLASGTSLRHQQALSRYLIEGCKRYGMLGMEGEQQGEWILLDFNSVVVHLMLPETRAYYDLEQLWDDLTLAEGGETVVSDNE